MTWQETFQSTFFANDLNFADIDLAAFISSTVVNGIAKLSPTRMGVNSESMFLRGATTGMFFSILIMFILSFLM